MSPAPDGPRTRRRGAPEGAPAVFAADEQADVDVEVDRLAALAEHVLAAESVRGGCELSLFLVDETSIAELNQRFLGKAGPTDVLAFPIDEEEVDAGRAPDGGSTGPDRPPTDWSDVPILLGDVVVCPAVAARNAIEHGRSTIDELALLVVHGVLHVLGMDHDDPARAAAMGARQREHLAWFDPQAPAPPDPEAPPPPRGEEAPGAPATPP